MSNVKGFLLLSCCALGLSACTYFDAPPPQGQDAVVVDLTRENAREKNSADESFEDQSVEVFSSNAPYKPNASVEVYSLDAPVGEVRERFQGSGATGGSVEVFSAGPEVMQSTSRELPPTVEIDSSTRFVSTPKASQLKPADTAYNQSTSKMPAMAEPKEIYFDHSSTKVRAEDMQALYNLAAQYKQQLVASFIVEGHASERSSLPDPVARHVVNLKVSMNRAFEVAKILMNSGVQAQDVALKAYGDTRPAAAGASEETNRRVEVTPVMRMVGQGQ